MVAFSVSDKFVNSNPKSQALKDPIFQNLLKLASEGKIPTYYGEIPKRFIWPFDEYFDPYSHEEGMIEVQVMLDLIDDREPPVIWVYPKYGMFIMSNDYHAFAAFHEADKEYLPCFILGDSDSHEIRDLAGPLNKEYVAKFMGADVRIAEPEY